MSYSREKASCAALLFLSLSAEGHEGQSELLEELIVYARSQEVLGVAESSSEGIVGYDDITLPPLLRVGELVEAVPGMVATQHSGTGKANQYFLRGFNLDHGTDFSAFANGVPLNMRTHGHGQGYLDLNFLITELVATTSYRKGPYSALVGDFSSAGSVNFDFYDRLEESVASVTVGEFDYYRGLVAGSVDVGGGVFTGALDMSTYSGPWELDEDLGATKFYAAYSGHLGNAESRIALSGYSADWNSTDQVPRRAVTSGLISPTGYIDPNLGGYTDRYELTGSLSNDQWKATAYIVDYDFGLFSNFTYGLDNPVLGDQFEQTDRRLIYGARIDGESELTSASRPVTFRWGGDMRFDDIREVGLFETTERVRNNTIRQDSVSEFSASVYGDIGLLVTDRLRTSVGLRGDLYKWDVEALRTANSGDGSDAVFSPKMNLAYRTSEETEVYVNWGRGFHSNDVRGTVINIDPGSGDPADKIGLVSRSNGAEVGMRMEKGEVFNATATVFWLELDSELIFVGDAGNTEPNGASRRYGIELASFWQPTEWLAANLSYTQTDAKFIETQGGGRAIPGAVESSAMLGLNGAWDNGFFTSLRLRYLGSAPLVEDESVESGSSLLVNAGFGFRWQDFEFRLDGFNLLDSNDDDISYYYTSRLEGEPLSGVDDVHFHPFEPRMIRASVSLHW